MLRKLYKQRFFPKSKLWEHAHVVRHQRVDALKKDSRILSRNIGHGPFASNIWSSDSQHKEKIQKTRKNIQRNVVSCSLRDPFYWCAPLIVSPLFNLSFIGTSIESLIHLMHVSASYKDLFLQLIHYVLALRLALIYHATLINLSLIYLSPWFTSLRFMYSISRPFSLVRFSYEFHYSSNIHIEVSFVDWPLIDLPIDTSCYGSTTGNTFPIDSTFLTDLPFSLYVVSVLIFLSHYLFHWFISHIELLISLLIHSTFHVDLSFSLSYISH